MRVLAFRIREGRILLSELFGTSDYRESHVMLFRRQCTHRVKSEMCMLLSCHAGWWRDMYRQGKHDSAKRFQEQQRGEFAICPAPLRRKNDERCLSLPLLYYAAHVMAAKYITKHFLCCV